MLVAIATVSSTGTQDDTQKWTDSECDWVPKIRFSSPELKYTWRYRIIYLKSGRVGILYVVSRCSPLQNSSQKYITMELMFHISGILSPEEREPWPCQHATFDWIIIRSLAGQKWDAVASTSTTITRQTHCRSALFRSFIVWQIYDFNVLRFCYNFQHIRAHWLALAHSLPSSLSRQQLYDCWRQCLTNRGWWSALASANGEQKQSGGSATLPMWG